ncbi:putative amidohydrolase [Desulfitispora alkaliphila]|uniref:nitrilase-related carbon-nitrogen hydrolase n=1 Tax=Desulfitispora alkaliphila TaxID=622674 RepID=UPI003D1AB08F
MKLKLAIFQMLVEEEKEDNLLKVERMVVDAVKRGANMVVLPEMFNCPYDTEYFSSRAEEFQKVRPLEDSKNLQKRIGFTLWPDQFQKRAGGKCIIPVLS